MLDATSVMIGDVIRWGRSDNDEEYIVGRVIGFLTKEASINETNTRLAAVIDVMFYNGESANSYIQHWNDRIEDYGMPELTDELAYRVKYYNSRLAILSMTYSEQFFGLAARIEFKEKGLCPRCGHRGEWVSLAVVCPWHGIFI